MSFTRSTTDISVHQKLGDYPNQDNGLTPEELKKRYDYPAETLQKDLNKLEEELEEITGASNVGAVPLDEADESNNNVQAKLQYLHEEIQNTTLGGIPDGTITEEKMESNFLDKIAKKTGELQVNLNAEKIGGETLADLREEMSNQKALYIEDTISFEAQPDTDEVIEKEYQLDNTRLLYIMFSGAFENRTIKCVMTFDCNTNQVVALTNYAPIGMSSSVIYQNGANLNYRDFAYTTQGYQYRLTLSSIIYDQESKKLKIKYLKSNSSDDNTYTGEFTMILYGISGKI